MDVDECEVISIADEMRYIKTDGKHYFNVGIKVKYKGGEARVMEPDKCLGWKWYSLDKLPEKMLEGTELVINNFKKGMIYSAKK